MTTTKVLFGMPLALLLVGCTDVEMPDGRHIGSVRVLGVQAEPPTLGPGETTQLRVACADGRQGPKAAPDCDVEVAWFGNCSNPAENDPSKCMDQYGAWSNSMAPSLADATTDSYPAGFGFGPTMEFTAPTDILAQELDVAGQRIRYGISYFYFMVCAGRIQRTKAGYKRLPVECHHRTTAQVLDQRSKVVGITTVYSYDVIRTTNPEVEFSFFDLQNTPPDCSVSPCPANYECSESAHRCVPVVSACTQKGTPACNPHSLMLALTQQSVSLLGRDGSRIEEPKKAVWLDLYTNAGFVDEEARFVLGPVQGLKEWSTPPLQWWAPPVATEHAHIWAVIRDNRGGVTIFDQPVIVR